MYGTAANRMGFMRGVLVHALVTLFGVGFSQTLAVKPAAVQFVDVSSGVNAPVVTRGGTVTLWVDVTPRSNIHVYAAGAAGFSAVRLVMTPRSGVRFGKPVYPPSELASTVGISRPVPMYRKAFRLAQAITVERSAKVGETITLGGAVNYQACDERLCYPPASMPVFWSVIVR